MAFSEILIPLFNTLKRYLISLESLLFPSSKDFPIFFILFIKNSSFLKITLLNSIILYNSLFISIILYGFLIKYILYFDIYIIL